MRKCRSGGREWKEENRKIGRGQGRSEVREGKRRCRK